MMRQMERDRSMENTLKYSLDSRQFSLNGGPVRIVARRDGVKVGCYWVSREALFQLVEQFKVAFPDIEKPPEVVISHGGC